MTTLAPAESYLASLLYGVVQEEHARRSLAAFSRRMAFVGYEQPAHVLAIIDVLEALERNELQKAMIFTPPQHSKSTHVSQLFPAFSLGRHPNERIILASYAQELATRNARAVREYVRSERWPFEQVDLQPDSRAAHRWNVTQGGGVMAVGVGAGITGFAGDGVIVIDDPHKDRQEADSPVMRENAFTWWTDAISTRRGPRTRELYTATRWHEDDLGGRILNSKEGSSWHVLSLPAFAEEGDALGRPVGAPLWESRYSAEWYAAMQARMGERSWNAMYQQRPSPLEGGMFKRANMVRWTSLPPDRLDAAGRPYAGRWTVLQSVDTAWDKGVSHDPSSISTIATDGAEFFLLDYWSGQVEYPDLKAEAVRRFEGQRWRPSYVLVEEKANGRPLIQEFRRTRLSDGTALPVIPIDPKGSKEARAEAVTPVFNARRFYLPPDNPAWLQAWIEEMVTFPNAPHDESVDTTSQVLLQLMPQLAMSAGLQLDVRIGQAPMTPEQQLRARLRQQQGVVAPQQRMGPSRIGG